MPSPRRLREAAEHSSYSMAALQKQQELLRSPNGYAAKLSSSNSTAKDIVRQHSDSWQQLTAPVGSSAGRHTASGTARLRGSSSGGGEGSPAAVALQAAAAAAAQPAEQTPQATAKRAVAKASKAALLSSSSPGPRAGQLQPWRDQLGSPQAAVPGATSRVSAESAGGRVSADSSRYKLVGSSSTGKHLAGRHSQAAAAALQHDPADVDSLSLSAHIVAQHQRQQRRRQRQPDSAATRRAMSHDDAVRWSGDDESSSSDEDGDDGGGGWSGGGGAVVMSSAARQAALRQLEQYQQAWRWSQQAG